MVAVGGKRPSASLTRHDCCVAQIPLADVVAAPEIGSDVAGIGTHLGRERRAIRTAGGVVIVGKKLRQKTRMPSRMIRNLRRGPDNRTDDARGTGGDGRWLAFPKVEMTAL